jgi:hypothetical protein
MSFAGWFSTLFPDAGIHQDSWNNIQENSRQHI